MTTGRTDMDTVPGAATVVGGSGATALERSAVSRCRSWRVAGDLTFAAGEASA